MAHKLNFGQKFLVWTSSLIMISIVIPLTAEVAKASCPLPSLVTNQSFPSGANNQGAAVGDVNNDGKLDIVTTNNIQPNNQISVMLGIGDGTFQSPVNTTTENGGTRIVLADFNNDTKLDVAITLNQASGVIAVHLGNGNGTFGFSDIFSAGNFPALIHSADFNNDGKRDIVFTGRTVATGIDHFGVMFGTGTGTFGTPTYYPFNQSHGMIDTLPIDINENNFINLVATRSNRLSYPFINNGNGTFTELTPTSSIDGSGECDNAVPTSAAVGDFNADGRNEVAVGYRNDISRVGILFRNGASNAQQPFILRDWYRVWVGSGGSGNYVSDIAAADFNGDGRSDLAFLESDSQSISIQLDTTVITNGTSSPPTTHEQRIGDNATSYYAGVSPRQVLTGDFNNDGKIDLAVRDENGSALQILLNSGAGRFKAAFRPFVITRGAFEFDESKNDLNGDGLTDLVGLGGETLSPFLGSIKGTFRNTALRAIDDNILNPLYIFRISLGDFDGDGKKDIVGAGINNGVSGLRFLRGNGDGTFTDSNNSTNQGVQYYSTAVGDFNSDNKLDVVAITGTNIGLFRGNGQGVFFSPINFPAGTDLRFIVSQDFNGNGRPDVAATDFAANRVIVLLGNGAAGFGTPVNFTVGTNPTKLALADFNTDGKTDIAVWRPANGN